MMSGRSGGEKTTQGTWGRIRGRDLVWLACSRVVPPSVLRSLRAQTRLLVYLWGMPTVCQNPVLSSWRSRSLPCLPPVHSFRNGCFMNVGGTDPESRGVHSTLRPPDNISRCVFRSPSPACARMSWCEGVRGGSRI